MGLTILFSEQNLQFATKISDRAYIIEKGCIQFQGTIEELEKNSEIQEKYLMILARRCPALEHGRGRGGR